MLWLVEHLPEDSAFVASVRGGPVHRPWTSETRLLASLVNLTYAANRQRVQQRTRKFPIEPPKPKTTSEKRGRQVRIGSMSTSRKLRPSQLRRLQQMQ